MSLTTHQDRSDGCSRYTVRRISPGVAAYHDAMRVILGPMHQTPSGNLASWTELAQGCHGQQGATGSLSARAVVSAPSPACSGLRGRREPSGGRAASGTQATALSADLLFGAYLGGKLVSACLAVESPGATALVLAPDATGSPPLKRWATPTGVPPDATLAALRTLVSAEFARANRLLQALLWPEHDTLAGVFRDAGFHFLTQLLYLEKQLSVRDSGPKSHDGVAHRFSGGGEVEWTPYSPETEPSFLSTVEATYAESLDCPGLTGLRTASEVLAGHQAAGDSGTRLWWVAMSEDQPRGVLLLAHQKRCRAVEVVYMGLVPSARGSGLASALLARAVEQTLNQGADTLILAVDRANTPARRLYARWGFVPVGRRDAWIIASDGITD